MAKKKTRNKKKKRKRIKDNYSFKEMDQTFEGTNTLQEIHKISKEFGYSNPGFDAAFKQFDVVYHQYNSLKIIPDRFNQFFAKKGWIAFESLNFPLMEKCVWLAEEGKPDEAEEALIEFFTNRYNVDFLATRLISLQEFRPRRTLLLNALEDHFHQRYHASVPLFLILIDGFVNDFERVGFFAEKVDLTVWDTIAAHDSGLGAIAKILGKSRKKTYDEEITLPYRNGILHGRDLGYANVYVSAKALSTLLALKDWADAIKKGKKEMNKEFVPPTLDESLMGIASTLEQMQEIQNQRQHMEKWGKRELAVGESIPAKGEIGDYGEDTPEKVVIEFLYYLLKSNYGNMAKLISQHWNKDKSAGSVAGELREIFERKKLIDFELVKIHDNAPAISEVEVLLTFERSERTAFEYQHKIRVNYEDENGDTVPRGYKKAIWKILKFSLQDIEYIDLQQSLKEK
jgi:hypothetical protein